MTLIHPHTMLKLDASSNDSPYQIWKALPPVHQGIVAVPAPLQVRDLRS